MTRNHLWTRLGAAILVAAVARPAAAQTIAITGGTVLPGTGPKIERGTVVITNGWITAVGATTAVPGFYAKVIDAAGEVGHRLIHADASAGAGIRGLGGQGEANVSGNVTPLVQSGAGSRPGGHCPAHCPDGRDHHRGHRARGSFVQGQAIGINLAGETAYQMVVLSPAALAINLTEDAKAACARQPGPATIAPSNASFADALDYDARRLVTGAAPCRSHGAACRTDALLPALRGHFRPSSSPPTGGSTSRTRFSLLAQKHKLKLILRGAVEGRSGGRHREGRMCP
ncbi:MAG: hypothetical protein R2882_02895 [Gemmatimonadales bacterium]